MNAQGAATAERVLEIFADRHSRISMTFGWISLALMIGLFLFAFTQNSPSASFAPLVMAVAMSFVHGVSFKNNPGVILAEDHASLLLNPVFGRKLVLYREVVSLKVKGKNCIIKYTAADDAQAREKTLKLNLNMFDEGPRQTILSELAARTGCDIQHV